MALISNQLSSLYGGINQQSAEHRQDTQVEDMVNAVPTIDRGLLKRNPTKILPLRDTATFDSNMWTYSYDRGLAGNSEEKYTINISKSGMEIINVLSGKVYNKNNNLLKYEDTDAENNDEDYISDYVSSNGYSAITIKDTTFINNKAIRPSMLIDESTDDNQPVDTVLHIARFTMNGNLSKTATYYEGIAAYKSSIIISQSDYYPSSVYKDPNDFRSVKVGGSNTTVLVDGTEVVLNYSAHTAARIEDSGASAHWVRHSVHPTYNEYISDIVIKLSDALDSRTYKVSSPSNGIIDIKKLDGADFSSVSLSIFVDPVPDAGYTSVQEDYYGGMTQRTVTEKVVIEPIQYKKQAFIWIKSSNPEYPYSYSYSVSSASGQASGTVSNTTSDGAATDIKADINNNFGDIFLASVNGSIVQIETIGSEYIENISVVDTWGNLASFAWHNKVQTINDLPKSMNKECVVNVNDSSSAENTGFWLKYDTSKSSWVETIGFDVTPKIDYRYMPHILVKNSNDTFTFKKYDKWSDMQVGDSESNEIPSILNGSSPIKDMFFFKNRLGFITNKTVVLSEVGNYGNFWRTTVVSVLDSDRIDTSVDTTAAIHLEYATYLEDSVMLFSDKAQFKLQGGKVLSPKDIQISQTSAYEINKNIRPIFMNNKIFFAATRGEHNAIMQYEFTGNGRVAEVVDVSAHVQTLLPSGIIKLSGSAVNNMLFITDNSDTVYVYKYYDNGDTRVQSAWFKWTYNGTIYNAFSLGKNLNILIHRNEKSVTSDWVLGSGIWNGSNMWTNDGIWIGSLSDLTTVDNFETQEIFPQNHIGYYVDASHFIEDTTKINVLVSKTGSSSIELVTDVILDNEVVVEVLAANQTTYIIEATIVDYYGVTTTKSSTDRKLNIPYKHGSVIKKYKVTFTDVADNIEFTGFKSSYIGSSHELAYNSDFSIGIFGWTFTDWDIKYGQKELGSNVQSRIDIGEWIYSTGTGNKDIRGILKFKTVMVTSEAESDFGLLVSNTKRTTTRKILSKYTIGRKPMIYGDAKDVRISIISDSNKGFRINSVSFEGALTKRDKRL